MPNLKHRQEKLKFSRQKTSWKEFVKEITTWYPIMLYKHSGIISRYPQERIKKVITVKEFEEHRDTMNRYGSLYDFSKDFFENFKDLMSKIDWPNLLVYSGNENVGFSDQVYNSKNVYLTIGSIVSENTLYSLIVKENSTNVLNSVQVLQNSENIYMSVGIYGGYNVFYSRYLHNCSNIWFSTNLIGCKECMFCDGLENKSFCINNKEYFRDEYFKIKEEKLKEKGKFLEYYLGLNFNGLNIGSENSEGGFLFLCKDIEKGYYCFQLENARNVIMLGGGDVDHNIVDSMAGGSFGLDDVYASLMIGITSDNLYMSTNIASSSNIYYSFHMEGCSHCLGCIGLKNKQYCILNKQYSKEEWYETIDKIFTQMESDEILGTFFPGELNPFYVNDTAASFLMDLEKTEMKNKGFLRRDDEIKVDVPEGSEIISASAGASARSISDFQGYDEEGEWKIDPEIMKKVIIAENGNYYRIVKMEYDFLMKHGLPIPEIHWLERIKLGFKFN